MRFTSDKIAPEAIRKQIAGLKDALKTQEFNELYSIITSKILAYVYSKLNNADTQLEKALKELPEQDMEKLMDCLFEMPINKEITDFFKKFVFPKEDFESVAVAVENYNGPNTETVQSLKYCVTVCGELHELYNHQDKIIAIGTLILATGALVSFITATGGVGIMIAGIATLCVALKDHMDILKEESMRQNIRDDLNNILTAATKIGNNPVGDENRLDVLTTIFKCLSNFQKTIADFSAYNGPA